MDFSLPALLFWLKKLLAALVLPPLLPLLPVVAGLLLLRRRPRLGRVLAWGGVALNLLLSLPASVGWLAKQLEDPRPLSLEASCGAQAIVVLGAGRRDYAPEYGGETLNRLALERVRYGARLARTTGLPLLVSGGGIGDETAEAVLMKSALEEDFGLTVRWAEARSRDTRENALFSAQILREADVRHVLLVTHAMHMPRAQAAFESAGLIVTPAPTGWLTDHGPPSEARFLPGQLPNANSAYAGWFAVHEAIGRLVYRLSQ